MTRFTDEQLATIKARDGYDVSSEVGGRAPGAVVRAGRSAGEELLALQLEACDVTGFEREHRFDSVRKWRFDFAWPDIKLAVEIEGLLWGDGGGRHQRVDGFERDLEKYEAAMLAGWTVYRCSHAMVKSGRALHVIEQMLRACGNTSKNTG